MEKTINYKNVSFFGRDDLYVADSIHNFAYDMLLVKDTNISTDDKDYTCFNSDGYRRLCVDELELTNAEDFLRFIYRFEDIIGIRFSILPQGNPDELNICIPASSNPIITGYHWFNLKFSELHLGYRTLSGRYIPWTPELAEHIYRYKRGLIQVRANRTLKMPYIQSLITIHGFDYRIESESGNIWVDGELIISLDGVDLFSLYQGFCRWRFFDEMRSYTEALGELPSLILEATRPGPMTNKIYEEPDAIYERTVQNFIGYKLISLSELTYSYIPVYDWDSLLKGLEETVIRYNSELPDGYKLSYVIQDPHIRFFMTHNNDSSLILQMRKASDDFYNNFKSSDVVGDDSRVLRNNLNTYLRCVGSDFRLTKSGNIL